MSENNNNNHHYGGPLELEAGDLSNREDLAVFNERVVITRSETYDEYSSTSRRPIPVSTIDWRSTNLTQFTPLTGLDFLLGVEHLTIQQTVDLHDMLAQVESENRYTVKVPYGETLYLANESSSNWQRMCFGSGRGFNLTLYDATQQQALIIERKFVCSNILFGCYPEEVTVWVPPGEIIGSIRQDWNLTKTKFRIHDSYGDVKYQIQGTNKCACATYKDACFTICSSDGTTQVGAISHQWDQLMVGYAMNVSFSSRGTDVREKALLLAAAFLFEYMYFERAKSSRTCCC